MKILVVGANGQLGQELKEVLKTGKAEIGEIDSSYKNAEIAYVDIDVLDITDKQKVDEFFNTSYDIVINCSAYTNVKAAETDYDNAYKVNALGVRNLALACKKWAPN